jgi:hypothetical protein
MIKSICKDLPRRWSRRSGNAVNDSVPRNGDVFFFNTWRQPVVNAHPRDRSLALRVREILNGFGGGGTRKRFAFAIGA